MPRIALKKREGSIGKFSDENGQSVVAIPESRGRVVDQNSVDRPEA